MSLNSEPGVGKRCRHVWNIFPLFSIVTEITAQNLQTVNVSNTALFFFFNWEWAKGAEGIPNYSVMIQFKVSASIFSSYSFTGFQQCPNCPWSEWLSKPEQWAIKNQVYFYDPVGQGQWIPFLKGHQSNSESVFNYCLSNLMVILKGLSHFQFQISLVRILRLLKRDPEWASVEYRSRLWITGPEMKLLCYCELHLLRFRSASISDQEVKVQKGFGIVAQRLKQSIDRLC